MFARASRTAMSSSAFSRSRSTVSSSLFAFTSSNGMLPATTAELRCWHDANPDATGRQLLERLQATYPGRHPDGLLRTVQRRAGIMARPAKTKETAAGGSD